jgi:hypothetical protein
MERRVAQPSLKLAAGASLLLQHLDTFCPRGADQFLIECRQQNALPLRQFQIGSVVSGADA